MNLVSRCPLSHFRFTHPWCCHSMLSALKPFLLPSALLLLALGLWQSPAFQQIGAGVAIFLLGMMALERGFQLLSGSLLQHILQNSTDTRFKALSFGVITTSIMQSSSLVSVLTISFLSAGLIPLAAGLGIIFGANLGTTTGAWLIAGFGLKVSLDVYAMPLLVFGVALLFHSRPRWQGLGNVLVGIGLLFLGIHFMKEGFTAFQDVINLDFSRSDDFSALLLYLLIGIVATVIMQSSHATLVLILTALAADQIGYLAALAIAIGANVGTTITALIGSVSANAAGRQLALGHVIFNFVTGAIALLSLPLLLIAVDALADWFGIIHNDTLKLAIFHTLFNGIGVMLMVPCIPLLTRWLPRLIQATELDVKQPKYLNESALQTPQAAIAVSQQETLRLFRIARDTMIRGMGWRTSDFRQQLKLQDDSTHRDSSSNQMDLAYQHRLKPIYSAIIAFITLARHNSLKREDEILRHIRAANFHIIEAVKGVKHLQDNLMLYLDGDNAPMAASYQELRHQIADVLILAEQLHREPDLDQHEERLAQQQQQLFDFIERMDHRIDGLIRDRLITPNMATSLITDKGYTQLVCESVLKATRYLLASPQNPMEEHPETTLTELTKTATSDPSTPTT